MSLTLGEKLRQAREESGFTLSEVADQTRISPLYLESIENDDYRILPGGIFNKGFVKSYAKFVGVNEQEALTDYSRILSDSATGEEAELKIYRPEVLTDDRSSASMTPTIIFAVVILTLMTAGVLFLVDYLRQPLEPAVANNATKTNVNAASGSTSNPETIASDMPDMATLKVEFKSLIQPVRLAATSDGTKSDNVVAAGSTVNFEPKESLTLNYNRWNARSVQLTINGKTITLPAVPLNPKDNRIEFTISKDNLAQIWASGSISTEVPTANPDANASAANLPTNGVSVPTTTVPTPVRPTPLPKPSVETNSATKSTLDTKPAESPKPVLMQPKPAANRP